MSILNEVMRERMNDSDGFLSCNCLSVLRKEL